MRAQKQGGLFSLFTRAWCAVVGALTFVWLLLLPVVPNELPANMRVAPRW
jgi:hypothetical protein